MAMYNRYIPNGTTYTRISEHDPAPAREREEQQEEPGLLTSLFKSLKLEGLDTGDILLLLVLLFLFLEGDDMELVITLGLVLLLGLD